jgi:hypothetical protein
MRVFYCWLSIHISPTHCIMLCLPVADYLWSMAVMLTHGTLFRDPHKLCRQRNVLSCHLRNRTITHILFSEVWRNWRAALQRSVHINGLLMFITIYTSVHVQTENICQPSFNTFPQSLVSVSFALACSLHWCQFCSGFVIWFNIRAGKTESVKWLVTV